MSAIQPENQTLATITFQNYFRLYEKLAGMTGTAATEAEEFCDIYGLDVVEVPTNMAMIRDDEDDEVYRTAHEKYQAIIAVIEDAQTRGQPMLVGTTSIEKSEILSELLKKDKVPHQVLNARYHEQEANRRPGRRARRRDDRHQHGRPRHRHPARRQPRHAHRGLARRRDGQGRGADARSDRRAAQGDRGRGRQEEADGARRRRPLRDRHRAPRKPPHRQPAARPLGPPGRPRPLELLPVARGRPDAHLRLGAHGRHAAARSA